MQPFRYHVFCCSQTKPEGVPNCASAGATSIHEALCSAVEAAGIRDQVQVTTCGCMGLCDNGPALVVYPEGTWYRKVRPEDVAEIVESHLKGGEPVKRLVWDDPQAIKAAILEHEQHVKTVMKARDASGILPDPLTELIRGFMPSRIVLTALELDVFTRIGSGSTAAQVASKIKANVRATEMLLNALVSLELLTKDGDRFANTATSARFFSRTSKDNARDGLLHTANLWSRWSTLTDCIRTGTSVAKREQANGAWAQAFIAAMDRNARERMPHVITAIVRGDEKRVLDLGGGSGAYSIALMNALPQAQADILDVPPVVPLTREYVREAGLEQRIAVREGDMLSDSLGEGYDLVMLNAICHMFSEEQNQSLFKSIHKALAPNGRLAMQDFILEPDKTSPRHAALFSLNMLVGTESGASYSEPEYDSWLRAAGFTEVTRIRLPGTSGIMLATKK